MTRKYGSGPGFGPRGLSGLAVLLVVLTASPAKGQTAENVLLIANSGSKVSNEIADYYASKRSVPSEQVLRLALPDAEEISRSVYESEIERPISAWLVKHGAEDRILYIVLTKGVPIRVAGTIGLHGTVASVDSELTLLYRKLTNVAVPVAGSLDNPYFLGDRPVSEAKPFTHRDYELYLVSRLDGFTASDAKALVDRAAAPSQEGKVLLDGRPEWTRSAGNAWLEKAADNLRKLHGWSNRVVLDTGIKVLRDESNVLGYYSWGSNDSAQITRHLHLQFQPGALAAAFVSTDARTFREPPESWQLRQSFGGSTQSLVGDLIRDGVTGSAGHVAEPYLNATIRPDILFPAYVSGFNLIESFYLAMPFVSWQTVVLGDPLCAPFKQKAIPSNSIDPGIDPTTELPVFLSGHRVAALTDHGAKPRAAKLFVSAQVRLSKQDRAGAIRALEEATAIDDSLTQAQLTLAELYQVNSLWDAAIDRYRRVLGLAPNHPVALNNLAYELAEHKHAPAEALPIAKRAYVVTKGNPAVSDTLGWVQHRLGHDEEARPLLAAAVTGSPQTAVLHLHLAIVLGELEDAKGARQELERAIVLDKSLETQDDVQRLRARLEGR